MPAAATALQRHCSYVRLARVLAELPRAWVPVLAALRLGYFYWSAKAFDVLERLDPAPEYWQGKRGACVGALQMVAAGGRLAARQAVAGKAQAGPGRSRCRPPNC
jgi:hypothetical protein